MKLKITSSRGHHECDVAPETGRTFFDKMVGLQSAPLPDDFRARVPDTFRELKALWTAGNPGYMAVGLDRNHEMVPVKEFDPEAEQIIFIAPITGG